MSTTLMKTPCAAPGAARWDAFLRIACETGTIAAIGSLLWKPIPGTTPVAPIVIEGFRKEFNTRVTRCRGTPAQPGLVLGLEPDREGVAHGMLLRVSAEAAAGVWTTFRERELGDADYVPALVAVTRRDTGEAAPAVAVLVDTRGASYVRAGPAELAAIISGASGLCGTNLDYAMRSLAADRMLHGELPAHLAALQAALAPRLASGESRRVGAELKGCLVRA